MDGEGPLDFFSGREGASWKGSDGVCLSFRGRGRWAAGGEQRQGSHLRGRRASEE